VGIVSFRVFDFVALREEGVEGCSEEKNASDVEEQRVEQLE